MTAGGARKTDVHVAALFIFLTNPRQVLVIEHADLIREFDRAKKPQQLVPIVAETIHLLPVRGKAKAAGGTVTTRWRQKGPELPLLIFDGFAASDAIGFMPPNFRPAFWIDISTPTIEFHKHHLYWQLRCKEFWPFFESIPAHEQYSENGADGLPLHHLAVDANDDSLWNLYFNHTVDWTEFFDLIKKAWAAFLEALNQNLYKNNKINITRVWENLCTENANLFIEQVFAMICEENVACAALHTVSQSEWEETIDRYKQKILGVFEAMAVCLDDAFSGAA